MREYVRIRPGFLLLLTAAYMLDRDGLYLLCILAAALHELGHLAAIHLCGGRVERITLDFDGGMIRHSGLTPRGEAVTALAGPCVNLAIGVACAFLPASLSTERLVLFTGANMALGLYNLLPVRPLDGGRALESLGFTRLEPLEMAVSVGFLIFGLYICRKTGYNGTVLCAAVVLMLRVVIGRIHKKRMILWKTTMKS